MDSGIVVYIIYITIATAFAFLAQKFDANKNENKIIGRTGKIFWLMSLLTLTVFVGFRECGVGIDDNIYRDIFNRVGASGMLYEFSLTTLEPGYLLLNKII